METNNCRSNTYYQEIASAYWNDICRTKELSWEEQKELLIKVKQGDMQSRDLLVESFLKLVANRAKIFCNDFDSFMDHFQEGTIGLLLAIERFDANKGCCFSTYATQWIDRNIRRASYRTQRPIWIPEYKTRRINRMLVKEQLFVKEYNREPTNEELAELLSATPADVQEMRDLIRPVLSLDEESSLEGVRLYEQLEDDKSDSPEEKATNKDLADFLHNIISNILTPKEQIIIKLRFGMTSDGKPRSLQDIADKYGVARESIRKTEKRALQKIQREIMKTGLTQFDLLG